MLARRAGIQTSVGPYPLATLALAAFFPFAFIVFKRFPAVDATCIVVLAGSVFLPELATLPELPIVPTLEKERVTYLAALLAIVAYHRDRYRTARPGRGPEKLFLLAVIAFLGTIALNRQAVFNDGGLREPLGIYWFLARTVDDVLTLVVPFVVGRTMFKSVDDLKRLLYFVAGFGLLYSALIVVEAGLSIPFGVFQLSQRIYGVAIIPSVRWGMVQPVVFLDNGLSIASFMAVTVVCATALIRGGFRPVWWVVRRARVILLAALLMTLNVAGIVYGYTLTVGMSLLKPRLFARLAMLLALFVLLYPAARMADIFPNDKLVELAARWINEDRAFSLEGRFLEEDFVLGNIGDRLWVGWGMFDRIPGAASFTGGGGETGLDSFWIIRAGLTGVIGIEVILLMLALPVFRAWRAAKAHADSATVLMLGALMACVSLRMVDLLLNGLWSSLPFFLAGALYGVAAPMIQKGQTSQQSWRLPVRAGRAAAPRSSRRGVGW